MSDSLTIQQAVDAVIKRIPGGFKSETVDTFKSGNADQPLQGVVTTFIATRAVLDRAVELGANLVITHEPTFYNHIDKTDWLKNDPVFQSKMKFLEDHGLVVWRFHDYWHRHEPDGIVTGVIRELRWDWAVDAQNPNIYHLAETTLGELAQFLKDRLHIRTVRLAGDPTMSCKTIGMLVGAYGGERQIKLLGEPNVDVMVCGESSEWETCEYVRDSAAAGKPKGLIILGHCNSEELGMRWLVEWLRPVLPGIPATFVPAGDPFLFV
jgi:putative NIF3 family GTP cyclohydrolase 1 type 2